MIQALPYRQHMISSYSESFVCIKRAVYLRACIFERTVSKWSYATLSTLLQKMIKIILILIKIIFKCPQSMEQRLQLMCLQGLGTQQMKHVREVMHTQHRVDRVKAVGSSCSLGCGHLFHCGLLLPFWGVIMLYILRYLFKFLEDFQPNKTCLQDHLCHYSNLSLLSQVVKCLPSSGTKLGILASTNKRWTWPLPFRALVSNTSWHDRNVIYPFGNCPLWWPTRN